MDSHTQGKQPNEDHTSEDGRDFASLEINDLILRWLYHKNLRHMTRVQSLTIKTFLRKGNDVLVQSRTGSGKTLCFVIPILHTYMENKDLEYKDLLDVFALVVLPTRELATQVFEIVVDALVFMENGGPADNRKNKIKHTFTIAERKLYCSLIIGGTTVENDVKFLSEAKEREYVKSFVLATPGRLSHLMEYLEREFVWTFKNLAFLILDEADRFLEMGYQSDMKKIFTHLPKQRKTGLFSATLTSGVSTLSKLCLSNQIFINADDPSQGPLASASEHSTETSYATPKGLNNYYLILSTQEKLHFALLFIQYLKNTGASKLVLFFLSCDLVDYFYELVTRLSLDIDPLKPASAASTLSGLSFYKIHRKMTTKKRSRSLNQFKSGSPDFLSVLLCTDIFSRGIDIPNIDWILQFDPPQDPNFYLHRIGRAGRADAVGNALLLLTESEESYIQFQINRKISLNQLPDEVLKGVSGLGTENDKLPLVLRAHEVEKDTTVSDNRSYFEHLKSNGVPKPLLPWERTAAVLAYLRVLTSMNRDLLLSSSKAFVSYTRAYSEHSLKYIFEKNKLDYGALATSLGVLRIPRVKEILGKKIDHFVQSAVNPVDVPFPDPEKESRRLKELKEFVPEQRVKKEVKKEPEKKANRTRSEKRVVKRKNTYDEWNEFRREEALVKKLKKKQFDQKNVRELLDSEEISGLSEEFEVLDAELDPESVDSKQAKKWILRGKGRKKRR